MPILNDAVLLIGSNIEPEKNDKKRIDSLSNLTEIKKLPVYGEQERLEVRVLIF